MNFHHISVMPQETVSGLVTNRDGIYVDCTLGGAGHSHLIADMLSEKGRLIGIDQDESAIAAATERLQDCHCQVSIVQNNFRNLEQVLQEQSAQQVDGVLFWVFPLTSWIQLREVFPICRMRLWICVWISRQG